MFHLDYSNSDDNEEEHSNPFVNRLFQFRADIKNVLIHGKVLLKFVGDSVKTIQSNARRGEAFLAIGITTKCNVKCNGNFSV